MVMTVMDFSGIYEREPWMRERKERWISFRGLPGTDGYCTDEAAAEIRRRIAETHARGIHFLDSGNYHYLTKFWIEKIREPFELIVFDRHSDMQPSALLPLTSCGNWLLEALEEQPLLRRMWLIGPAEETIENVPAKYRGTEAAGRVVCVCDREACSMPPCWEDGEAAYPVYLSIDKDVLRKEDAPTNWDQGILTTELLLGWLDVICQTREVLGADICGEPAESGLQAGTDQECRKNDEVNRRLAEFLGDRMERKNEK